MALFRRNYRDLSPEHRREGAKAMRERIRGALASPGLTDAQIRQLHQELAKVAQWESGGPSQESNIDPRVMVEDLRQKLSLS